MKELEMQSNVRWGVSRLDMHLVSAENLISAEIRD